MFTVMLLSLYTQLVIDFNSGREVNVGYSMNFTKVSNDELYGWTSDTVDDIAEEYSGVEPALILVGYILMILYCGVTFMYFDWVRSHVSVGLVSGNLIITTHSYLSCLCLWYYYPSYVSLINFCMLCCLII